MMPTTITYPETKRVDIVEKPFGQTITDPYRKLRRSLNLVTQIFRENTMKAFLTCSTILLALATSMIANIALPAKADSTANLLLNLQCEGGYNVNIWKTKESGELLYRSTSPNGNLSLGRGTSQATEGVRVYKFQNANYQYWFGDGTLDSQQSGTLEVYKNNAIQRRFACTKR